MFELTVLCSYVPSCLAVDMSDTNNAIDKQMAGCTLLVDIVHVILSCKFFFKAESHASFNAPGPCGKI
jgi:hypothetical protein